MTAAAYCAYGVTLGVLVLNGWHLIDVRHGARMSKINAEAAEKFYKITREAIDDYFTARKAMDRRMFKKLGIPLDDDEPAHTGKPS